MVGRLGYESLPILAAWRADLYLSLNSEQRTLATRRIEAVHVWHRRTQLDDYRVFLQEIQRQVAAGEIDEARIRAWRVAAFDLLRPIAEQAAPGMAEVAMTLTPAQVAHLREEMERDNTKMRKEWMPASRADRVDARVKRYVDRAEMLFGSLTSEQKQFARRFATEAPDTEEQWYEQRLLRQQDVLELLERIRTERPPEAVAAGWVREHLMRYTELREGPGKAFAESSLARGDAMSVGMFARATPKQRAHLQRKLQEWADLLQALKPAQTAQGAPALAVR